MDLDTLEKMHSKLSLADLGKPALIGIAVLVIMVAVLAGRNLIGTATATEFELCSCTFRVALRILAFTNSRRGAGWLRRLKQQEGLQKTLLAIRSTSLADLKMARWWLSCLCLLEAVQMRRFLR